MIRKDVRIVWLPGDHYSIEGVARDVNGKPEAYYGDKLGSALFLIKALFQLLSGNRYPMVSIIVVGHELCKEGGEE